MKIFQTRVSISAGETANLKYLEADISNDVMRYLMPSSSCLTVLVQAAPEEKEQLTGPATVSKEADTNGLPPPPVSEELLFALLGHYSRFI